MKKTKDLKLNYTNDSGDFLLVKKLVNKALKKVKAQRTIEFKMDNTLKTLKIFDVFEITQPDFGLNKAKFRVIKTESTLDQNTTTTKVTAKEYSDVVYDDSSYEDGITSPPIKPPSVNILAPVSLEFIQTGTKKGTLTWVNRHFGERKYQISYKPSAASGWGKSITVSNEDYIFENLQEGLNDFRVRVVDVMGLTSDWTTLLKQNVQGSEKLPVVTGLSGNFTNKDAFLEWNDMKKVQVGFDTIQDIFSHYEVVIIKPTERSDTFFTTDNTFVYPYSKNVATGASRALKIEVYVVDKDGNRSYQPARLNLNNLQCSQPSGLKVKAILGTVTATWDNPLLEDYAGTQIHISADPDFIPSPSSLVSTSTSNSYEVVQEYTGIRYLKIGHFDVFGSDGISYSPTTSFTQTTIDDHLDNSNNWGDVNDSLGNLETEVNTGFNNVNKEISNLGNTIDTGLASVNQEISGLDSKLQGAAQDIVNNAKEITSVKTTLGSQQAQITSNKNLITGVSGNLASFETEVSTEFEGVKSSIQSNSTSISNVNSALTQHKESVSAEFKGVKANIESNKTAVANANKAITALDTKLSAKIDTANASISQNQAAIVETNKAVTALDTKLSSEIDGVKSNISQNYYTKTQTDGKVTTAINALKTELNSSISGVDGKVDTVTSNLAQNYYTKTSTDGKISTAVSALETKLNSTINGVDGKVDSVNSNLSQNFYTKTQTNSEITSAVSALETKLSSEIEGVDGKVDSVTSNLSQNFYTKTQTDGKISSATSALETKLNSSISGVQGSVDSVQANLANNYYTKTQSDGKISTAVAASESKLNAEIGKNKAAITTLNQVTATTDGKVEALTQIKHDVNGKVSGLIMGNNGETSTFDVVADKFRISSKAGDQAVFQVDSVTGKTVIRDALVGEMSAEKITSGVMDANRINATSTLTVGSGTQCAKLSGTDTTWRIAAGNSNMGAAPFRVDKTGKMFSTNADIQGVIRANQLIFVDNNIPAEIKNSNITVSSLGAETPAGAQAKANTAKSQAISTAATEAQKKADAALAAAKTDATNKANQAKTSAEAYALAQANAAKVAANAHADGIVTEAEAAAIAEAKRLASVAEANAKKDAAAAKTAADKAQTAANAAQGTANTANTTANTANNGVNSINGKLYSSQSKTQISSSASWKPNASSGWGIMSDGYAEFNNIKARGIINATGGAFNNVTINENCTVKGAIEATQIVGDIVCGAKKMNTSAFMRGSQGSGWKSLAYGTVSIVNARKFPRTLVCNFILSSTGGDATRAATARARASGEGLTTVYSEVITDPETTAASVVRNIQMAVNIPANWKGAVTFYAEKRSAGNNNSVTLKGTMPVNANDTSNLDYYWFPMLFADGGDLA
ncbi:phage tail tip protein [Vibrio parahaemolyticus]|uniref:phage tail tip protein n=1 Tax=Vibrio parahaemolyticus TaxID=670 RepID=UPI000AF38BCE|nr:hypothetical protein [Vibrio parahaemolyticus]